MRFKYTMRTVVACLASKRWYIGKKVVRGWYFSNNFENGRYFGKISEKGWYAGNVPINNTSLGHIAGS